MPIQGSNAGGDSGFVISRLIDQIPIQNDETPESMGKITCISSFDNNVYVGTSLGEILHYYSLNDEFVLISRQRAQTSLKKGVRPVNKILLLPQVNKALVLCGSVVNVFTLPELSPDNLGKIKDVSDLSIDVDSFYNIVDNESKENADLEIPVVLFTKKNIRLISVTPETLKLVKDIVYSNTVKGLRRSKYCLVATQKHYDLINIDSSQKIPLVPVSNIDFDDSDDSDSPTPQITLISKTEYLVTCGSRKNDASMGMILNENGDASRGTLTWNHYPDSVQTIYPYTLSTLQNELIVHSISTQNIVQKLPLESSAMELVMVNKVFAKEFSGDKGNFISKTNILMFNENSIDLIFQIPYSHRIKTVILQVISNTIEENSDSSGVIFSEISISTILKEYRAALAIIFEKYTDENYLSIMDDLQNIRYSDGLITSEDKDFFNFVRQCLYICLLFSHNTDRCLEFWKTDKEVKRLLEQNTFDKSKVYDLLLRTKEYNPTDLKDVDILDQNIKWLLMQPSPKILLDIIDAYIRNTSLKEPTESLQDKDPVKYASHQRPQDWESIMYALCSNIDQERISIVIRILVSFSDHVTEILKESPGVSFNIKNASSSFIDTKHVGTSKIKKRLRSKTVSGNNTLTPSIYGNKRASLSDSRLPLGDDAKLSKRSSRLADKRLIISTFDIDDSFSSLPINIIQIYCKVNETLLKYYISAHNEEELLCFICEKLTFVSSLPSNYGQINDFLTVESFISYLKDAGQFNIVLAVLKLFNKFSDYLELWMAHGEECQLSTFLTVHKYIINSLSGEHIFETKEKKLMILKYLNYLIEQNVLAWALKLLFASELSTVFEIREIMEILETLKDNNIKTEDIKRATEGRFENIIELKIHYLEILSEKPVSAADKNSNIGLLLEFHVYYLKELFSANTNISNYLSEYLTEYRNLDTIPKVSILDFVKMKMKSAEKDKKLLIKSFNTTMKLFNILDDLSSIKPVTKIPYKGRLSDIGEILDTVYNNFSDSGFSFHIIRLFIDACRGNIPEAVDQLLSFTDFNTAETYIVSRGSKLFDQTIIVPPSKVVRNEEMMNIQLLKVFKHYLGIYPEKQMLLQTFLSTYGHYFDAHTLISTLPANSTYSLKFINDNILMKQLIKMEATYEKSLIKKQLARSNIIYYNRILKQMKK